MALQLLYVFISVFSIVSSSKLCIDLYLADKFGDGWGGGTLKIFDPRGTYKSFVPVCDEAVFTSYCFDGTTASNGDQVTITAMGFEPYAPWEIIFEAKIRDSGVTYTGTYNTWMRFTYSHLHNVTLATSEFVQPNGLGPIASCIADNPTGKLQYWGEPTAAPIVVKPSVQPITLTPTVAPTSATPPTFFIAPSLFATTTTKPTTRPTTIDAYSTLSQSPSKKVTTASVDTSMFAVQTTHSRLLSQKDLEVTMSGQDDTWYAVEPGVTYNIFNTQGTVLYYQGTLTARVPSAAPVVSTHPTPSPVTVPVTTQTESSQQLTPPPPKKLPVAAKSGRRLTEDRVGGDSCKIQLAPGTYRFRVTGNGYSAKRHISWEFCDYSGGAQEELMFSIDDDGLCTPVGAANYTQFCSGFAVAGQNLPAVLSNEEVEQRQHPNSLFVVPTTTVLKGVINLGGVRTTSDFLSAAETSVLQNVLATEFSDAYSSDTEVPAEDVSLLAWTAVNRENRKLSDGGTLMQLTFTVKVQAERLGVSSSNSAAVRAMVQRLQSHLSLSVERGVFVAKITSQAISGEHKSLQHVSFAELLQLSVLHETVLNEEMSSLGSLVVLVGCVVGIVCGAVLLLRTEKFRKLQTSMPYEKLAVESVEDAVQ